jgi:hypothetical protein
MTAAANGIAALEGAAVRPDNEQLLELTGRVRGVLAITV